MKPTTFTFDIPTPCHEKWNNMDERPDGRFCHSCQKTVINFSKMSDMEMAAYFQNKNGNTCGRIEKNRLLKPIPCQPQKPWANTFKALGLLLSGLFIGTSTNGQSTEQHEPIDLEIYDIDNIVYGVFIQQPINMVPDVVLGIVRDENGLPLKGVSILPKAPVIGTLTDDNGNFLIYVPPTPSGLPTTLEISYEGFKKIEITPNSFDQKNIEIVLKKNK